MVFDGSCYRGWADKDFELMQYTAYSTKTAGRFMRGI